MGTHATAGKREICPRCRATFEFGGQRCPGCGERIVSTRRVSLYLGIVGILALIFIVLIMVTVIKQEDDASKAPVDLINAPLTPDPAPGKAPPSNK